MEWWVVICGKLKKKEVLLRGALPEHRSMEVRSLKEKYCLMINRIGTDEFLKVGCGISFILFAVINAFFLTDCLGSLFDPKHLFSHTAYDHVRPFMFFGYYLVLVLANALFGLFLMKWFKNRMLMISGIIYLMISIAAELSRSFGIYLLYRDDILMYSEHYMAIRVIRSVAFLLLWTVYLIIAIRRPRRNRRNVLVAVSLIVLLTAATWGGYLITGWGYYSFRYLTFELNQLIYNAISVTGNLKVIASGAFLFLAFRFMQTDDMNYDETNRKIIREILHGKGKQYVIDYILESCGSFLSGITRLEREKVVINIISVIGRMRIALMCVEELCGLPNGSAIEDHDDKFDRTVHDKDDRIKLVLAIAEVVNKTGEAIDDNEKIKSLCADVYKLTGDVMNTSGLSEDRLQDWINSRMLRKAI